ncbi:unnamed protein product [Caenorhabditis angaria]|uniref:Signal peptidase complex subunit 1 n=1 Tax=Caenorhabditis angaria TaxID=860376 RepID=A0A9P1I3E0_9PELO|nr:unnamed protein product [Caenorhabditis angaria]
MDGIIAMLPAPIQKLSTHLDFRGQRVAETTYHVILTISGIIAFFVGYWTQQLSHSMYIIMASALFTALIILPPWPFLFRKNPIVWQTPNAEEKETKKTQ